VTAETGLTQEWVTAIRYEVGELGYGRLDCHGLGHVRRNLGWHHRAGVDGSVGGLCTKRELQHLAVGLRDHRLGDDRRGSNGERRLGGEQRRLNWELLLLLLLRLLLELLWEQGSLLELEQRSGLEMWWLER